MTDGSEIKHLERAEFLVEINRWREAIIEIREHLKYYPNDYEALCQMARCFYGLDELQSALDFAKKAIVVQPEYEWAYRLQSLIFRASGNNTKALVAALICAEKAPYLIYSLQTLAFAQTDKFLLDDAKNTADIMLEMAPDAAETHDVCGYLAIKFEDWEAAEKHFKLSLQIEPLSYIAQNNLGNVYFTCSEIGWNFPKRAKLRRKAIECFESSIKINPTFKSAQENLKIALKTGVTSAPPVSKVVWSLIIISISLKNLYPLLQYFGITFLSVGTIICIFVFLVVIAAKFITNRKDKNL